MQPPYYLSQEQLQMLQYLQQNQSNLSPQQHQILQQLSNQYRLAQQYQQTLRFQQQQQPRLSSDTHVVEANPLANVCNQSQSLEYGSSKAGSHVVSPNIEPPAYQTSNKTLEASVALSLEPKELPATSDQSDLGKFITQR